MDSDPPVGERDLRPSPGGQPTLWFDVVNELSKAETRPSYFMFCYSNPNIVGEVAAGTYEIALRGDDGNISVVKHFRIRKTPAPAAST